MKKSIIIFALLMLISISYAQRVDVNGGALGIAELNTIYLRTDGTNKPTAAYSWTTDLTTTGNITAGGGSDTVPIVIKAIVGQTANMFEIRDSNDTLFFWIDASGNLHLKSGKRIVYDN